LLESGKCSRSWCWLLFVVLLLAVAVVVVVGGGGSVADVDDVVVVVGGFCRCCCGCSCSSLCDYSCCLYCFFTNFARTRTLALLLVGYSRSGDACDESSIPPDPTNSFDIAFLTSIFYRYSTEVYCLQSCVSWIPPDRIALCVIIDKSSPDMTGIFQSLTTLTHHWITQTHTIPP
jgi:hypothetical protein